MLWWRNLFRGNVKAGAQWVDQIKALATQEREGLPCSDNPPLPAHLIEIKDTYENAMVSRYEDHYIRTSKKLAEELDVVCISGTENIQLMRSGMFNWLSDGRIMKRWAPYFWALFILGMLLLAILDFAPTTLVFSTLMEDEGIAPMYCLHSVPTPDGVEQCTRYLLDRESITLLAVLAFLFGVVMTGHVMARVFFGEYFDRNVSMLGKGLLAIVALIFVLLSGIRYIHEEKVALQKYSMEVRDAERTVLDAVSTDVARDAENNLAYLKSPETKAAKLAESKLKNIFASSIFSIISLMIMLAALYLSIWHKHGDVGYLIRQRKFITARIQAEEIRTQIEDIYNIFSAKIGQLRQSAQREAAEFFIGAETAIESSLSATQRVAMLECIKQMRESFNKSVALPSAMSDHMSMRLPQSELDWGAHYRSFIENALCYDAFEKGAQDAVNLGVRNVDSIAASLTTSIVNDQKWQAAHPKIEDATLLCQYEAGFLEGTKVEHGKCWEMDQAEAQPKPDKSANPGADDNPAEQPTPEVQEASPATSSEPRTEVSDADSATDNPGENRIRDKEAL